MARGRFITLEGGEGAGKSTQQNRLVARLSQLGHDVVATREPGGSEGGEARFEAKGIAFHQRLRQGFLDIAAAEPDRCVVIDSHQPQEAVAEAIWAAVRERLGL